jgi:hypothetical protein
MKKFCRFLSGKIDDYLDLLDRKYSNKFTSAIAKTYYHSKFYAWRFWDTFDWWRFVMSLSSQGACLEHLWEKMNGDDFGVMK